MEKGAFCLSIDTELLWGRTHKLKAFRKDAQKVRSVVKKLLALLKKYEIPATWAIVGELLNQGKPLWHAPELIQAIRKTKNQEIACHSYSHLIFAEKKCPARKAQKELENCLKVAKKARINFKSFVFPYNKIGYLKFLKKHGFACFRGPEPHWYLHLPRGEKFFQLLDFLFLLTPPVSKPSRDSSGLINIPGSMYYLSVRGPRKYIPIQIRTIKAKKGLHLAAKTGQIFHLWFHAIDLTRETKKMLKGLETIFVQASKLEKEGKLEIKSMGKIAKDFLS